MEKQKLAVIIDGGLGRVLCAIPALQRLNQNSTIDLLVVAGGWIHAYHGSGLNVIPMGLYHQQNILADYEIEHPEPYYNLQYRNGEINMVQAFAQELGVELDEYVPFRTDTRRVNFLMDAPRPVVALQPFGSGGVSDSRSMTPEEVIQACAKYKDDYAVFVIGTTDEIDYLPEDVRQLTHLDDDAFIRLVQSSTKYVGCDTAGLHIAAAAGVPQEAYLSTTSGIKYYENTEMVVRKGFEDMRVNPRL